VALPESADAAVRAFADAKGWRLFEAPDRLIARGAAKGRRVHFWTYRSGPELTFVVEHNSGLSFKFGLDYVAHPLSTDYQVETGEDGFRRLVDVEVVASEGLSWFEANASALPRMAPLHADETLTVTPQTLALQFHAASGVEIEDRLDELLAVADRLPLKKPHRIPARLRPLTPLIRRWALSDDQRREAQLSKASAAELQELAGSWRENVDLINATIEADPSAPVSVRLMAFAQAGLEAEALLGGQTQG